MLIGRKGKGGSMYFPYYAYVCPYCQQQRMLEEVQSSKKQEGVFQDQGKKPFIINLEDATKHNNTYRTALWTGEHLQLTLMSIRPGEDIGLEVHPHIDQFIRIEEGQGLAEIGKSPSELSLRQYVGDGTALFIPAGTWHNVTNIGARPMKLYVIYAPPNHPFGTVERMKPDEKRKER